MPTAGSLQASEIWTIRPVEYGEELTINYCESLESCTESRQDYLWKHHCFHCDCIRCKNENTSIESMSMEEVLHQFEETLLQPLDHESLRDMMTKIDEVDISFPNTKNEQVSDLPLYSFHGLRARKYQLLVNAAELGLIDLDKLELENHFENYEDGKLFHSIAFIGFSMLLFAEQIQYLDVLHPDIARTHEDIIQGLEMLQRDLSKSRIQLQDFFESRKENIEDYIRFDKQSLQLKMQSHRLEAKKIKTLYNTRMRYPQAFIKSNSGEGICGEGGDFFYSKKIINSPI